MLCARWIWIRDREQGYHNKREAAISHGRIRRSTREQQSHTFSLFFLYIIMYVYTYVRMVYTYYDVVVCTTDFLSNHTRKNTKEYGVLHVERIIRNSGFKDNGAHERKGNPAGSVYVCF